MPRLQTLLACILPLLALAPAPPPTPPPTPATAPDPLADAFLHPPAAARPRTWWHWINGNVNRAGITRDLEALRAAGVGGADIFNVGLNAPPGDARFMSPAWRDLVAHAIRECDRLGLQFSIHTCDGWSESGGPWITPDLAMQKLTWAELRVSNTSPPTPLSLKLPTPNAVQDYYKDIAVLAFPTPPNDLDSALLAQTPPATDLPRDPAVEAASPRGSIALPKPAPGHPRTLTWALPRPVTVRALTVGFRTTDGPAAATLEASDDGVTFRPVGPLPTAAESFSVDHLTTWSFPPITARVFRVVVTESGRLPNLVCRLSLAAGDRIDRVENKAGDAPRDSTTALSTRPADPADLLAPAATLDLTSALAPDGTLTWTPPPSPTGQWTILRLGHTLTGRTNQSATTEGRGLECDKLNPVAVRLHFDAFAARILGDNKASIGNSLNLLHIDSWEALCQNWTPAMRSEFQRLRGYDPLPYYPVFAGRIVTSLEVSEHFLYDLRRTIADLINEHHYALLTRLCNDRGVRLQAEALGPNMPTIAHGLEAKARVDIPMGEFWVGREVRADCKEAASSAHVHGKTLVSAEAFTAVKGDFTDDFFSLKPLGDAAFAHGINRFIFHRFVHQPDPDSYPGLGMGPYGINFDRTNTWWPRVNAWTDYLARCQFLLQRGSSVADVLYYSGENVPYMLPPRRDLRPVLPPGWDYDACSAEELLTLTTQDAQPPAPTHRPVAFPSGARYHLIVLPDTPLMSPKVLTKLRDLVRAGAVVVGPRPRRSASLTDYPACDAEVRTLATDLWGPDENAPTVRNRVGAGRVYANVPLADVLADLRVPPDLDIQAPPAPAPRPALNFIHRRTPTEDIYFLANPAPTPLAVTLTLRDAPGSPELWDPATGHISAAPLALSSSPTGPATLPLHFDPAGSVFVVFRNAGRPRLALDSPDPAAALTWRGPTLSLTTTRPGDHTVQFLPTATRRTVTVPPLAPPAALPGPWTVTFTPPAPHLGDPFTLPFPALTPWHTHPDPRVRGFSGTATYATTFRLPPGADPRAPLFLDLGALKNLAHVTLNGKDLGVLWKPPFRLDLAGAARDGENALELRVTNLWPNRLIADAALPPERRLSYTSTAFWTAASAPLESGLFGPVTLTPGARIDVRLP